LRHAHSLVEERTQRLLRANQELALAAKTSAVGALASHLIHGLRSPLTGLQHFVNEAARGADWENAAASTRRMQQMIHDVVNVLREQDACETYEVQLDELLGIVTARVQPRSTEKGVDFRCERHGELALDNRRAHLLAFILFNLSENAIDATPRGGRVCVRAAVADQVVFEVADQGTGFPPEFRAEPFAPRRSGKENGSGIGLAISRQLATQIGAELELAETSASGTTFRLRLPM
jgi:two-component system sensor histidine kinase FlrB